MTSKSDEAVEWLLGRIQRDPRLAYYFDFTESMARLTVAYAEANGLDVEKFRSEYYASLRFAEPVCRTGSMPSGRGEDAVGDPESGDDRDKMTSIEEAADLLVGAA